MTAPPDRQTRQRPADEPGEVKSTRIESSNPSVTDTRNLPDSGDVMECVMAACVGRPVCPWAPWSCVIGGDR